MDVAGHGEVSAVRVSLAKVHERTGDAMDVYLPEDASGARSACHGID